MSKPCTHCGKPAIANLDGDDLCKSHADQWVWGEGQAEREREEAEREHREHV